MNGLTVYGDAPELLETLTPDLWAVLSVVAERASDARLVGGVVRDLLLGRSSRDLDVLTETPVGALAATLQRHLGGTLTCHDAFLTCSLDLPALTLDLATARSERYPHPGALPVVRPSDLTQDLRRRDFTVNTFAVGLAGPHMLLSVSGAEDDLEEGTLRVLHERSFFDDPTRMVRGSRLAGRLGFDYDPHTRRALTGALAAEVSHHVSPARFKNELLLTLAERAVAPAVTHLTESGALGALYGLRDTPLIAKLDALHTGTVPESYLLALLLGVPQEVAAAHVQRFSWPQGLLAARRRLLAGESPRTDAERPVQRLLHPAPSYPWLRGSDVLSLGLPAGPEVGRVLSLVARARHRGQVASFADELELAKGLVRDLHKREKR